MCSGLLMLDIFMTFHSRCSESIAKSGTSLIDSLNIKITQPVSRFRWLILTIAVLNPAVLPTLSYRW